MTADQQSEPCRLGPLVGSGGVLPGFTAVVGTEDSSRAVVGDLGPGYDDVGIMIVGGPTLLGVSPGPRNDNVRDRDGSRAGSADLGPPHDDDVGTMIVVEPDAPHISLGLRNDGVGNRVASRVGAADMGPFDDDVGTIIVGGPVVPGVSLGPRDDSVGDRDTSHVRAADMLPLRNDVGMTMWSALGVYMGPQRNIVIVGDISGVVAADLVPPCDNVGMMTMWSALIISLGQRCEINRGKHQIGLDCRFITNDSGVSSSG